jgi:hypothetical protein
VAKPGFFVRGYISDKERFPCNIGSHKHADRQKRCGVRREYVPIEEQPYLSLEINNGGVSGSGSSTTSQHVEEEEKEVYKAASARREREPSAAALRNIVGGDSAQLPDTRAGRRRVG